ncbi:splicing factor, Prp19-binding domain-domain-containing protein [Kockovaella imperatae]|uniref:Splicing factor, Prp19-binding domain-domain-containing protein n=1 Tax=Kockovaella imperatae TaxID=4999 RepID=A0A1Y1U8R3_9TREE|nr:splicing factor, Prp19-binding domain-domain-containing protein [Kockovaella imperatae]ORX33934.1 splicing factor, Prp19-binding domain-domain-containing protein [Kockovaella imperatae]
MASMKTMKQPLVKPSKIRYFKGKAPDAALSGSDSDEDEEDQVSRPAPQPIKIDKNVVAGGAGRIVPDGNVVKMKVALRDVKVEGGRVVLPKAAKQEESSEEETDSEEEEEEEVKPQFSAPRPKIPIKEESSEYETDSEEESEEEKKPAFRPVFIKKDARGMTQEKAAAEAEEKLRMEEELQLQRKLDSKELAGETIRRELAEREAVDLQPTVDDTDGLDDAAEFDAWRARELGRLLRDKKAQAARDEEREEIERRRALPEEQRLREDMEYAESTRAKEKGQMGFLQKYYHKGAFHQDEELLNRDYTAATEGAIDMSILPQVMQVRDFGKRSRSKYTHLTDQDTSQGGWGTGAQRFGMPSQPQGGPGQPQQGCWNCGGPHMRADCPNADINNPNAFGGQAGGFNANTSSLGGGSGRGWVGDQGGKVHREQGKERKYDEERRGYGRERNDERPRDRGYDRDRSDRHRDDGWRRESDKDDQRERDRRERSRSKDRDRRRGERDGRDDDRERRREYEDRKRRRDEDDRDRSRRRYD